MWISVEDRLPRSEDINSECNPYYIINPQGFDCTKAMFIGGEWYTSYCSKVCVKVTHWFHEEGI